MIFGNNTSVIFIDKDSLKFFFNNTVQELKIAANVISNLEILDATSLNKLLEDFFSQFKLKKRKVTIVLAENILFEKIESKTEQIDIELKRAEFISSVPLDPGRIALKTIEDKESITFVATNKELFRIVIKVIENLGNIVNAVVPLSIIKEKLGFNEFAEGEVRKLLAHHDLIKNTNFLSEETGHDNSSSNFIFFVIIIFIISLISAIGSGIYFKFIPNPLDVLQNKTNLDNKESIDAKNENKQNESTISSQINESSESAKQNKEDVEIQILNGSEVSGLASKIKNKLIENGFSKVDIGNAEEATPSTIINFSKELQKEFLEEVAGILEEDFEEVEAFEATESAKYEILVLVDLLEFYCVKL